MKTKIQYYEIRQINDIKEMINSSASLYGDNTAFLTKNKKGGPYKSIKYKELKEDIDALGTSLLDLNLAGKNIAVIGENCYEWMVAYLAVVNGVGVVVPLDKELPEDELINLTKRAEVSAVFYTESYANIFISADIPYKINMSINYNPDNEMSQNHLIEKGKSLIKSGITTYNEIVINPDEMKIILFTSGTTDMAKGVMLCHKNICSVIMSTCKIVHITEKDRTLSILPIHHTFESTLGIMLPLYRGASVAFTEGLKYISNNMLEAQPTVLISVPLILENIYWKIWKQAKKTGQDKKLGKAIQINNKLKKAGIDLSKILFRSIHEKFGGRLRLLVTGAASIDPVVIQGFEDLGIKVTQGYGLTECAPLVAGTPDTFRKVGSVGPAVPGVEIKLIDVDNEGIGEIICRGPNVMLGYYKDKENTDKVLKDGWLHTGDLAYVDSEGCYFIAGRKKNVIITKNGKNIYPEEVEFYLNKNQYIEESLVSGVLDSITGETRIIAQLRPAYDAIFEDFGENIEEKDLHEILKNIIHELNDRMPIYKRIRDFSIRKDEFIKTTTKKIKRHINK
ncbi:MAG: AMP-binding protein [Clostridiales bacterium]|nr:AMP-binding protein [Clostridiales bacterium]